MGAALALPFAPAMDATAVSAARAFGNTARRELVILPLVFGGFQSGMSALGWLGGTAVGPYLKEWEGWVAPGLLGASGINMVLDAFLRHPQDQRPGNALLYFVARGAAPIDPARARVVLP